MENFLSKIFNSKSKKRVYNVDKSKKQNLKKANKNLNQLSSAYFTNKLRKEFGIYKSKSEFSSTRYNIPCAVQNREHSIESVDIIPQSFHEQQNIDLLKCTIDREQKNRSLLFVNDSHSDMEPESINKEFGIDENEGCDQHQNELLTGNIAVSPMQNMKEVGKQDMTSCGNGEFSLEKEQEETSNEDSSITNTDTRKDSAGARYDDPCLQLHSYKCNKEFIFESKKGHEIKSSLVEEKISDSKKLSFEQDRTVSVFSSTKACTPVNRQNIDANAELGYDSEKGAIKEIHDLNKFLITKKGRIKCKASDNNEIKKYDKVNEDDGLSRHRYYHSMIILGGKKKSKTGHSKNVKITSSEILEMTHKKFGSKKGNKIDMFPCDKNRLNMAQSRSTVRTMCYRNSSKFCATSIPPSEHTLKWLDENFGPGSKNTILNDFDENEGNFSDPLDDIINIEFERKSIDITEINDEFEGQRTLSIHDVTHEANNLNSQKNISSVTNNTDIANNQTEIGTKEMSDENHNNKQKTVKVVSFRKSRTLKSSTNSYEYTLDDPNIEPNTITNSNKTEICTNNSHPLDVEVNLSTDIMVDETKTTKVERNDFKQEDTFAMNTLPDESQDITIAEPKCIPSQEIGNTKATSMITETVIDNPASPSTHQNECESVVNTNDNENYEENAYENSVNHKELIITEPTPDLKLQNESIFGILRAQEKKNLVQEFQKENDSKVSDSSKLKSAPGPRDDKIVLKLNDKLLDVVDQDDHDYIKRRNKSTTNKLAKSSVVVSSREEKKRRHEELEKDYIMTRLELALNTKVIEEPEMAKYILEKSQEVIKDVMEKTNENITKKLLAQRGEEPIKKKEIESLLQNSMIEKQEDEITHKKKDLVDITVNSHDTSFKVPNPDCDINEKMVKLLTDPCPVGMITQELVSKNPAQKDLNNISKIENVKIYRKENKKGGIAGAAPIRMNSIDNIMRNKNLLLEEIKSLKRKK